MQSDYQASERVRLDGIITALESALVLVTRELESAKSDCKFYQNKYYETDSKLVELTREVEELRSTVRKSIPYGAIE
jgi:hypothetical protein